VRVPARVAPKPSRVVARRRAGRGFGLVAFVAVCGATGTAAAADFSVQPQYTQEVEFDTNPLLAPKGGKTLYGTVAMPELTLSRNTDSSSVSFDNRLDISRDNLPSFSSSDLHSTLFGKQSWEISYFSMSAKLDYDTTRNSEFSNSGVNVAGVRHTGVNLAPEFSISLSPRNTFVFDANALIASYGDPRLYQGYVFYGVTPSLQHAFDTKNVGSLILQANHYNTTTGFQNSADTIGPALGVQRKLTQTLTATISGGYQLVKITIPGFGSSSQFQSFYTADLKGTFEYDTLDANSQRQVQPESVGGRLITQTSYGLTETHLFGRGITDNLSINYFTEDYTTPILGNETSFLDVSNKISYRLAKQWVLQGTLRYRREGRFGNYLPADSEATLVNLVFTPPEIDFR
jgi:hypothetical protein